MIARLWGKHKVCPNRETNKRRALMKKTAAFIAALAFAMTAPIAASAAQHDHGSMQMEHGGQMTDTGKPAYEEVVDGVKVTFRVITMAEMMKGMEMPKGVKETHHVMAAFQDAKTGKAITAGEVKVKIIGPDKTEQVKDLMGMEGHFGADFDLSKKGKYGVMAKFKVKDGKVRSSKFWYVVK
jgi:hypothetical protein